MTFHYHTTKTVGTHYATADGKPLRDERLNELIRESRQWLSHNNPKRGGMYIRGLDWISSKKVVTHKPTKRLSVYWGDKRIYKGKFYKQYIANTPAPPDWSSSARKEAGLANLRARGAEAWNRMRPEKPDFSLANELYELKDLPGMFQDSVRSIRDRVWTQADGRSLRRAAEYNLAVQFGWLPVLGSIQQFVETQRNAQKRIAQLIRDAGRPVRRTTRLKDVAQGANFKNQGRVYENQFHTAFYPILVTQAYNGSSQTDWQNGFESDTWAEGRFRYHLPPGPHTVEWKRAMLRRLYGYQITPSMVYNMMPWSWLLDYFAGLGQFLEAVSPGVADRLSADYLFIMRKERWWNYEETQRGYQGDPKGQRFLMGRGSVLHETINQYRVAGSPFGWGWKDSDLSATQLGILGSLGLSRV